jgi:hypothetical protein
MFVALGALCGTMAVAANGGISVKDARLRFIIPSRPAAGYFTLDNDTSAAVQLVGASSTGCGMLMLHQSSNNNGVETMRSVKSVAVPPHGSISFAPGAYHLMCMSPAKSVSPGKTVAITLKFGDGRTVAADFVVRGAGDK